MKDTEDSKETKEKYQELPQVHRPSMQCQYWKIPYADPEGWG